MRMKQFIYLATALLIFGACSQDQADNGLPASGEIITVSLSLQPSDMRQVNLSDGSSSVAKVTRSVTALADAAEKVIDNLWVFEYVDGTYVRGQYLSTVDASNLNLDLSKATSANIYFVANVGEAAYKGKTLGTETAFKNYNLAITNEASITPSAGYLPMFGEAPGVAIPDYFKSGATVTLDYMVSRVDFSYTVTGNMSSGFVLKQARLIGVPRYMYPYINPENMDADDTNDTNFPADTLTTQMFDREAIDVANATAGSLTFYLPDNRRGVGANTAATDAKLKAGLDNATAIQLIGYKDGDEITYNFYLGGDQFNDYNLKRNTKYTLTADLDGTSTGDLRVTKSQAANTYLLKPGRSVLIPVKRANQSDLGEQLADVSTGWTPVVLWRDNSALDIAVTDTGNGVMEVTASSATAEGNAVVYIKDGSDNILWSWHVWVTNYDPQSENDMYNGFTFMDRNLGALNDTKNVAGALGLLYQWGRKDPFVGSSDVSSATLQTLYSGGSGSVTFTLTSTATPSGSANNLIVVIRNPDVFYYGTSSPYDWYLGSSTKQNDVLWGITKTVYDPCPAGWKVPPSSAFSSWEHPAYTWDTNGRSVSTVANSWYPATGKRSSNGVGLSSVGTDGYYWSSTPNGTRGTYLYFEDTSVTKDRVGDRAYGFSVRCVQEN